MCALIGFLCFMGMEIFCNPSVLLGRMLEHDYLDTSCFGRLTCMCFILLHLHLLAQLSMFHMERHSRNTITIIIISLHFPCNYHARENHLHNDLA